MRRILPAIIPFALSTLVLSPGLMAQTLRQSAPHVHGITHVTIALENQDLQVELEAPGINVVGFEHPPGDAQQQAQLKAALALLGKPQDWMQPADAAQCRLADAQVTPHGYDTTQTEGGHEHADVDARYDYRCAAPDALAHIDIHLAERFPATHQLVVDLVLPQREDRQVLEAGSYRVRLAP
ncbi:ZrgA family zinc uptake protein [Dyella sedimenti]|uniref:ZrgA family zinc uptake protein n=1 Tax=Dyella sedimenti TaxID=2919947 RepID=UPI001FAA57D8|nr:DUF2796 domain-containing protein [Dyella sedimenti]